MTMREFYTAILNNETLSTEIRETAQKCIATLDKRNENRSSKPSKKAEENKVLAMDLLPYFDDGEAKTCADILTASHEFHPEFTSPKVTALLKLLVANGFLTATEEKVPKKGKCMVYRIVK